LEFLTVKDLTRFGHHWEMFYENRMPTNIGESDAVVRVKVKHLLEKVLHLRSAINCHLLLSLRDCLGITEIIGQFLEFDLFSLGRPMRIELCVEKGVLKGNSMLSMK
jgi:hypothetical protein